MALLIRPRLLAALLLALTVLVTSCLVGGPRGPQGPVFSHALHVGERGLQCEMCHTAAYGKGRSELPGPQLCAPCHDRIDPTKPPERRIAALYDASGNYLKAHPATLGSDISFDHGGHVSRHGVDCSACHGDMSQDDGLRPAPRPGKPECMTCHADRGYTNACATCHQAIDEQWSPPSHDRAWERRHGLVARSGSEANVDDCSLCHAEETSCNACHREQMPRDHTNHWRQVGHGVGVSMDRGRCAVCHRSDFCQTCHETTRPRSHRGGFGSPGNRHCTSCHFPLQQSGCYTCHKGAPAHQLATGLPPGHNPASNCRACHGNGVRLPHHDPGQTCTTCHR